MREFFNKIINWIKNNKLSAFLLFIVLFFLVKNMLFGVVAYFFGASSGGMDYKTYDMATESVGAPLANVTPGIGGIGRTTSYYPMQEATPQMDITDRKVVVTSQMSILSKDVRDTIDKIQKDAVSIGGYMVDKNISTPRVKGSESGSITVRIPLSARDDFVNFLRGVGLKVVNEKIQASDVTDEYVDIEDRLKTLRSVKAKYEEIMAETENVDEILRVQQKIFQVQDQIDSLTGQLNRFDATSKSTLITVYVSTDELALPFTPDQPWRPDIVFKLAVRSLLTTLQKLGTLLIWVAVYAVIIVPVIVIIKYIKKKISKKKQQTTTNIS